MPSSASSCAPKREQLDIGLRLGGADDLGVELVELAVAPFLRPLVAEGRAVGRDLQRRELLPAFAQIRRGKFRR